MAKTILIVDDDPAQRRLLQAAVERNGFHTRTAENGVQAVVQVDSHQDIDIVLLDLVMPGMSGQEALKEIRAPLRIEAHLAPEDPRRGDLEHRALSKLRRVMPKLQVRYVFSTTIGLFEQTAPHYGEIWYELGGKREMSRATTAESALETIYDLAGVKPPLENDDEIFHGHPLAVAPKGAAAFFYGIWPAAIVAGAFFIRWRKL